MANSVYSVTFRIYDVSSGGVALFTETQSVGTLGGTFKVALGSATGGGVPDGIFVDDSRWLGITVAPDVFEVAPRIQLVSAPYAYRVNSLDSALGGTIWTVHWAVL